MSNPIDFFIWIAVICGCAGMTSCTAREIYKAWEQPICKQKELLK